MSMANRTIEDDSKNPRCPECHSNENISYNGLDFDLLGKPVKTYTCLDCGKEFSRPVDKDRSSSDDPQRYEDQICQDAPCGSAPLGCSDNRYCPRARGGF